MTKKNSKHNLNSNINKPEEIDLLKEILDIKKTLSNLSKRIYYIEKVARRMHRFIIWTTVRVILQFLLIIIPIIIAYIWFVPWLKDFYYKYKDILDSLIIK